MLALFRRILRADIEERGLGLDALRRTQERMIAESRHQRQRRAQARRLLTAIGVAGIHAATARHTAEHHGLLVADKNLYLVAQEFGCTRRWGVREAPFEHAVNCRCVIEFSDPED